MLYASVEKICGSRYNRGKVIFLESGGTAMFQLAELTQLNDCFRPLSQRGGDRVFFCRIAGYSGDVAAFLRQYYEAARRSGVIIDGRIPNPTPDNLSYFNRIFKRKYGISPGKWRTQ